MEIGPLEYVVLGCENGQFANRVLPELKAIQASGLIRVRDLVFVRKDALGTISMQEVSELGEDDLDAYLSLADDLAGLLTAEDIDLLARNIPPGAWAVLALFEHCWTLQLMDAVRDAGGMIFAGGMVAPEAWERVSTELAAAKEDNYA